MDHKAHIGLVNPHAEGVGGHHDCLPVELEVLLVGLPLRLFQPGVVAGGGKPRLPQHLLHPFHPGAGGTVDDAALVPPLPEQGEQGGALVGGGAHVKEQVGPVEAGDLTSRILKLQQPHDVLPDLGCGSGGEGGHHGPVGQGADEVCDLQIAGPEVLAPLGDAVGLIHRHQGDGHLPGQGGKPLSAQPLRGDIDQLVGP